MDEYTVRYSCLRLAADLLLEEWRDKRASLLAGEPVPPIPTTLEIVVKAGEFVKFANKGV